MSTPLASFAVGIAAFAVLASIFLGWLAYVSSRQAIMGSVARESLSIAQTIVSQVEFELANLCGQSEDQRTAIDAIDAMWKRADPPHVGSYLCVIEPPGILALHTNNPEMRGTDVSRVIVNPKSTEKRTVSQLIAAKESLATQNFNFRGKPQLAGYSYMPSIDSLVVVHVPAKLVAGDVTNMAVPWLLALAMITGLLFPLSVGLIHRNYVRTQRLATSATASLLTNEQQLRDQLAEIELLYRTAPVGLCLMNTDLRYVRINEELAIINGRPVEEHIGKHLREVVPDIADRIEPVYRRVIDGGEAVLNFDVERLDPKQSNQVQSFLVSYHPLKDSNDSVIGVSSVVQDITEIRRVERELLIRQQAIARSVTPTGFGDDQFRVTYANQAFLDLFGFETEDQVIGKNNMSFDSWPTTIAEINAAMAEHGSWMGEVTTRKHDGSEIEVFLHASLVRDDFGSPISSMVTFWDITDRKRAEEQLLWTQFSVDTCSMSIFWIRQDARFFFVNDSAVQHFGYTRDELLTMTVHDLDPAYPAEAWPEYWKNMQQERSLTFETQIRHKDGELISVEITTNLLDFESQEFVFAFVTDITQRKKAEERIRASEARFRALVENSNDVINMFSATGELIYTSPAIERVLGYKPEEMLQLSHPEIIHPEDAPQAIREFQEYAQVPGSVGHFVQRHKHKDGSFRTVEITGTNLLQEPGIHAMVSILRDVTQRTVAEERLRERESQLAHVARLSTMGEMVAGIAHEIKQPLHAIANFAMASSVALRDVQGKGDVEDGLADELVDWNLEINKASHRASEIVHRLRSYACKTDQKRELSNPGSLLRESVELMAFEARQNQIIVETQLPDDLPVVSCDRIQIQQVMVNLLHNAYEALSQQDDDRRVIVCAERHGDYLEIKVVDNGPGVSDNLRHKLFDAFYTTKQDGMGMGLAISRTIIEAHSGRVWVTANDFGGATFNLELPLPAVPLAHASELHSLKEFEI